MVLEACDELGILVYEEAPTWMSIGNEAWFNNYEKAARTMVRNHRNHPSVFMWGAGINHRGYVPRAHNIIKQEDPFRFTVSQSSRWTGWQTSGLTDIYGQMVYGPYYWSRDEPMLAMEGRRGPEAGNHYLDHPMKLGLISWTAHAYYTFHPSKNLKNRSRSGFMTIFRYPRPGLMWYKAELTKHPFTHIETDWKPDTKDVIVYSNAENVALLLNGKRIGLEKPSKKKGYENLKHAPFIFSIANYKKGTLTAHGLSNEQMVSTDTKKTPEAPYKILLEFDTGGRNFIADGSDILVAYAKVVDKNGTIIQDAKKNITFHIKGNTNIIGDGKEIDANPFPTEYGVAPTLIKATTKPGKITLIASCKGLKSGTATVYTTPSNNNCATYNPIYDFESIKVDIGAHNQLVQFDWIPWHGKDHKNATKQFEAFGSFSATIKSLDQETNTRWLGEINVIGKYGFAHGDGVLNTSPNGLVLELNGLKKGHYKLTTVHHAPRTNTDSMDSNREKMTKYKISKIPASKEITIQVHDANGSKTINNIKVTHGKDMQTKNFGSAILNLTSNGIDSIIINFKSLNKKGVWLNSFVLSEWFKPTP